MYALDGLVDVQNVDSELLKSYLYDSKFALRTRAADALRAAGWQPSSDADEAALAFAQRRFGDVQVSDSDLLTRLIPTSSYDLWDEGWSAREREAGAHVASSIDSDVSAAILLTLLMDRDPFVRAAAGSGIEQLGLEAKTDEQRLMIALTLRRSDSQDYDATAKTVLVSLLSDDALSRPWTANRLAKLGEGIVPILIEQAEDGESYVQRWVVDALTSVGPPACEALTELEASASDQDLKTLTASARANIGCDSV